MLADAPGDPNISGVIDCGPDYDAATRDNEAPDPCEIPGGQGGFDSVGKVVGAEIYARTEAELAAELAEAPRGTPYWLGG